MHADRFRWHSVSMLALIVPVILSGQMAKPPAARRAAPTRDAGVPAQLPLKFVGPATTGAITARDVMTRLYKFADDSMMGRAAGTIYNDKGTDYIASELRRIGLEPAGDSGTYFQHPLIKREVASASTVSVGATTFQLWTDFAPRDQGAGARSFNGATAIYGGRFGDSTTYPARELSAGKVVVVQTGLGPGGKPDHSQINRLQLTQRFPNAAAIVVASIDLMPVGYVKQAFQQANVMVRGQQDTTARPAYFYATQAVAQAMLGVALDSARTGQPGVVVNGRVSFEENRAPGRNVIAILRGSDPAMRGQFVAIGAHNDHVGFDNEPVDHDSVKAFMQIAAPQGADNGRPNPTAADWVRINAIKDSMRAAHGARPDSIYNGADDDGSGSMAVLEIAEKFATGSTRPKRSVLFIWHVAEELGLFGSEYFTDHPTVPRDSIVAQLNMDMVGRGRAEDFTGVTKEGGAIHGGAGYVQLVGSRRLSTELGDLVERVNIKKRVGLRFDYSLDADGHPQNIYCRSDHYEYARYGIPVVFFTTGGHADYHQVTDEPQYINYNRIVQISSLVTSAATEIANLGHRVLVDKPKPDPNGQCRQ